MSKAFLAGSFGLRGEQTDGWMDGQMENLPILQDFVLYRGRCPKTDLLVQSRKYARFGLYAFTSHSIITLGLGCYMVSVTKLQGRG